MNNNNDKNQDDPIINGLNNIGNEENEENDASSNDSLSSGSKKALAAASINLFYAICASVAWFYFRDWFAALFLIFVLAMYDVRSYMSYKEMITPKVVKKKKKKYI